MSFIGNLDTADVVAIGFMLGIVCLAAVWAVLRRLSPRHFRFPRSAEAIFASAIDPSDLTCHEHMHLSAKIEPSAYSSRSGARKKTMLPGDVITGMSRGSEEEAGFVPPTLPRDEASTKDSLRVMCWNVERGQEIEGLCDTVRSSNADVVLLQEVDVGCTRTHNEDVCELLARALDDGDGVQWAFAVEFIEIAQGAGVHGNVILVRCSSGLRIQKAWSVQHKYRPFDWMCDGAQLGEPRVGGRVFLGVHAVVAGGPNAEPEFRSESLVGKGGILFYSIHLENFCGPCGRAMQMGEVYADALMRRRALPISFEASPRPALAQVVIGGDLNTLTSGIVKCLPTYQDTLSFRFPFISEQLLWRRHVLRWIRESMCTATAHHTIQPPSAVLAAWRDDRVATKEFLLSDADKKRQQDNRNEYGMSDDPRDEADMILRDAFECDDDGNDVSDWEFKQLHTVSHPTMPYNYKLDWLLYSEGLAARETRACGEQFSDHAAIVSDFFHADELISEERTRKYYKL